MSDPVAAWRPVGLRRSSQPQMIGPRFRGGSHLTTLHPFHTIRNILARKIVWRSKTRGWSAWSRVEIRLLNKILCYVISFKKIELNLQVVWAGLTRTAVAPHKLAAITVSGYSRQLGRTIATFAPVLRFHLHVKPAAKWRVMCPISSYVSCWPFSALAFKLNTQQSAESIWNQSLDATYAGNFFAVYCYLFQNVFRQQDFRNVAVIVSGKF